MGKTLGELFERAGKVELFNSGRNFLSETGSITFLGSISPPGGDFSESVTQSALKVVGAFYALNTDLARARHFPAVDWKLSFSLYGDGIAKSLKEEFPSWQSNRLHFLTILKKEEEIERTLRLLGRDSLSEDQKCILDMCSMLKRAYLQQNAYDEIDKTTSMKKQVLMMKGLNLVWNLANKFIQKGDTSDAFFLQDFLEHFTRMWEIPENELNKIETLLEKYSKVI
jgi:V/A-type H+-transporting ATPase subunit A